MKKITLSIFLALGLISNLSAQSTCSANGTLTPTANPGEFTISDLSTTTGSNPYSYFISGESSGNYVYLQPNTTTGTYQYSQNGSYAYGFTIWDSIAGCYDSYWDSLTVTGIGTTTSCLADFIILQDSLNPGIYWCWNNSTTSSPSSSIFYLWDFGDGTTSTQPYPTHTYSGLGVYAICLTISEPNNCTSVHCDTIVVSVKASGTTLNVLPPGATASVEDNNSFKGLTTYPNPVVDKFTVSFNSTSEKLVSVTITNLAGQTIESTDYFAKQGQNKLAVNTSDLQAGIYLIKIKDKSANDIHILRIVKN